MNIINWKRKRANDRGSPDGDPDSSSVRLMKKSRTYGLEVLAEPKDESRATYDIVFVHGLRGSIQTTWLHEESCIHWPKDLISQDLSNFRVFAFGYDADVVNTWNPASKSRITSHAQDLLGALAGERNLSETNDRMIIFVGHSLGGLVIQQALCASKNAVEQYMQRVLESTYAIAFLGTPHLGADLASWAEFGLRILNVFKCSNTGALDVLQHGSEMLAQIQENFHKILRLRERNGRPIHITCFYEQLPLRLTGNLVVTMQSAVLPAYPSYGIHANHMDMTKFETPDDDGYRTILKSLLIWQKEMSQVELIPTSKCSLSADDKKLLQKFYTCDYDSHKMLLPSAVAGTCEWIQQHQKYVQWKAGPGPCLLWMTSEPGCGKSVLVSYLIDQLYRDRNNGSTVCYFFFSDSDGERNDGSSMMRCILHQIFTAQPHLFRHAKEELDAKGRIVTEQFATMWRIFLTALRDPQCAEIYCLVDALDECELHSRQQLIRAFPELFSIQRSGCQRPRLRMLVATRPLEYLKSAPLGPESVTLSGEEVIESINNDISLVVRARVDALAQRRRLSRDLQKRLIQRIWRDSDHTFLWATLVLGMLEDSASASEEALKTIVEDLSSDLDSVYEKLLSQISDVEMARKILHIVVAAFRPLTLKEINVALAIHPDASTVASIKKKVDPSIDYAIRKTCGPIIRICDSKVTLVHLTAKAFLLRGHLNSVSADKSWKHSLSPTDSHNLLTNICTKYLLLEEIKNDCILDTIYPKDVESDSESQCGSTISDTIRKGDPYDEERTMHIVDCHIKRYEFLDYSGKHWTGHYRLSERNWSLNLDVARLCNAFSGSSYYTWFYVYTTSSPMWRYEYFELSKLMVASYFGLENLAAGLIDGGVCIDETDEDSWTALIYAAWSGSEGIVKKLLQNGANVNAEGRKHNCGFHEDCTALMAAAENGHSGIVQLLIAQGAETETSTELALSTAAANGHESVVATLLESDCDIEERNSYRQVPLHHACLNGQDNVFRLLASRGANLFAKDENGRSALEMATESGSQEMVETLLAKGADVNGTDYYGTTAFDLAYYFWYPQILRILIDHGAKDPYLGNIDEDLRRSSADDSTYNQRLRSLNRRSIRGMDILRCFPWHFRKILLKPDGKGGFEDNPNWSDVVQDYINDMVNRISKRATQC